jgi:hypothetical protein
LDLAITFSDQQKMLLRKHPDSKPDCESFGFGYPSFFRLNFTIPF